MKPYYLDHVVNSQSETNDRRWWGASVVSARNALPHEVKVETVATRGGEYQFGVSRALFFYRLYSIISV